MQSRQEDTTLFVHGAKEQGRRGERKREREREGESHNTRVAPVN